MISEQNTTYATVIIFTFPVHLRHFWQCSYWYMIYRHTQMTADIPYIKGVTWHDTSSGNPYQVVVFWCDNHWPLKTLTPTNTKWKWSRVVLVPKYEPQKNLASVCTEGVASMRLFEIRIFFLRLRTLFHWWDRWDPHADLQPEVGAGWNGEGGPWKSATTKKLVESMKRWGTTGEGLYGATPQLRKCHTYFLCVFLWICSSSLPLSHCLLGRCGAMCNAA